MQSSSSQDSSPSSAATASPHVLADSFKCGVCFEKYNKTDRAPKSLVCGHSFCATCICKTEKQKIPITCPHCRRNTCVDHKLLGRNLHLIEILENTGNLADDDGTECDCPSAENADDTGGNVAMRSFVQDVDGELTDIYVAFAVPQLLEPSLRPRSVLAGMFMERYQRLNDDFEVRKLALNNAVTGMNALQERIRQLKDEMQQVGISVRRLPQEMRRNHAHRTATDVMPTSSIHVPRGITTPSSLSMADLFRQVSADVHMLPSRRQRMQTDSDSSTGSIDSRNASMPPSAVRGNLEHLIRANHMTITRREENATEVRCFICDERLSLTNTPADLSDVLRHTHSPRHQQLVRENDSMLAESGRGRTSPQPSGSGLRGLISSRERYRPNNELPSMQGNRWHSLRGSPPPYRPSWFPLRSGGAESANNEAARYANEWDETASVPRRATQRVRFAYPRLGDPVEYVSMAPNVELGITAERSTTGNLESRGGNGQPGNGSQWDVTSVSHSTSPTDHAASPELGAFGLADLTAELRSNVVNSENDNEHSVNDIDWDGEWGEPRREPGPRNYFDSVDLNLGLISFEDVSNAENIENPGDQPNDTVGSATGPIVDFSEDDTGDYRDYSSDVDSIVADAGRVTDNADNAGGQPWADSNPASEPPQHGFFHPHIVSDDSWYTAPSVPVAVQNSEANESNDSLSEFLRSEEEPVNREASGVGAEQQNATEQGIGRAMRPEALIDEIASLFENSPGERDRGRVTSDTASNAANVDFNQLFGQSSGAQARAHPTESDARDDSTDRATIIDAFPPSRNGNGSSAAPDTRQPARALVNTVPLSSLSRPCATDNAPHSNQNSPNPLRMSPLQQHSNASRNASSAIPRNPAYHDEADYENPLQRPSQQRSAASNSRPSRQSRISAFYSTANGASQPPRNVFATAANAATGQ